MTEGTLGARQRAILNAVVREYIRGGEPVASKEVVGRYRLSVSPATVRHDMSLLEELGYLVQPHTSAGRIPTDLGYRHFVDSVRTPGRLAEGQERELREAFTEPADLDENLLRASEILSRFTRYASAVLAPRLQVSRLRHLDLAWLGPRLAVAVLIGDGGRVDKRIVELDAAVTEADVEQVAREVNHELGGLRLDEAQRKLAAAAKRAPRKTRALLSAVHEALDSMIESEQRVLVGGAANLAADSSLGERETLRRVYETMERQTELLRLLGEAMRPVSVRIGSELPVEDLRSCSVVAAPYGLESVGAGTVGVIGPTRMDYLHAMSIVAAVARALERSLRDLDV